MADPVNLQDMNNPEALEKNKIKKKPKSRSKKAKSEALEIFEDLVQNDINTDDLVQDLDIDDNFDIDIDNEKITTTKQNKTKTPDEGSEIKDKNSEKDNLDKEEGKQKVKAKPDPNKTVNDIGDIHSYIAAQKSKTQESGDSSNSNPRKNKEYKNTLTSTALQAEDGTDLSKIPNTYAVVPHGKGDHKLVYMREDMPDNLWKDDKKRTKGSSYMKNGHNIYDVKLDFHRHPTLKARDGGHVDVWVIDSPDDLEDQLKAIRKGKGGGTNFGKPVINKNTVTEKLELEQNEQNKAIEEKKQNTIDEKKKVAEAEQEKINQQETKAEEETIELVEKEQDNIEQDKLKAEEEAIELVEEEQDNIEQDKLKSEEEAIELVEEEQYKKDGGLEAEQSEEKDGVELIEDIDIDESKEIPENPDQIDRGTQNSKESLADIDLGDIDAKTVSEVKENDLDTLTESEPVLDLDQGSLTDIDIGALSDTETDQADLDIPEISFGEETKSPLDTKDQIEIKTSTFDSQDNTIQIDDLMQENTEAEEFETPEQKSEELETRTENGNDGDITIDKSDDLQIDISDLGNETKDNTDVVDIPDIEIENSIDKDIENNTAEAIPTPKEDSDTINLDDLDFGITEENTDNEISTTLDDDEIPIPVSQTPKELPKMMTQKESTEEIEVSDPDEQIRVNEILPEPVTDKSHAQDIEKDLMPAMKSKDMSIHSPAASIDLETDIEDDIYENEEDTQNGFLANLTTSQKKRIMRGLIGLMFLVLLFVARAIVKFVSARNSAADIEPSTDVEGVPKFSDITGEGSGSTPSGATNGDGTIDGDIVDPNNVIPDNNENEIDAQAQQKYKEDLSTKLYGQKNQLRTLLNKSLLVENFTATRLANGSYQKANEAWTDYQANELSYTNDDLEEITNRLDLYIKSVGDMLE